MVSVADPSPSSEPILVFAEPVPPELAQTLDIGGWAWKAVGNIEDARSQKPDGGWIAAVVVAGADPEDALRFCRAVRAGDVDADVVLLLLNGGHLMSLDIGEELFDDFCLNPFHPVEFEARLKHLLRRAGAVERVDLIEHGPLVMNLESYQATIGGRPLDLTYMEYELLRFLASHPGKVFTREALLSRVWGYEYFGGARTVDVHVRRLRAKLGEEHANLIQTVRSVGYSFRTGRWG